MALAWAMAALLMAVIEETASVSVLVKDSMGAIQVEV